SWGSRIALVFGGQRQDTVIHCGVPGQPGFDTVPGCRIRSGPGCVADGSGQCALPRAQAAEVCRANPQCRGFTCPNGSAYCYARDADEVRRSVRRRSGFSSTVSQ
ncbi:MAG TPA: hypothetical protein VNN12_09915, partial [Dehalococcoidia bacterium]|nr:hypothetical protein [Dehalococcoidia bacterium]